MLTHLILAYKTAHWAVLPTTRETTDEQLRNVAQSDLLGELTLDLTEYGRFGRVVHVSLNTILVVREAHFINA